jgi:hypothetical protein
MAPFIVDWPIQDGDFPVRKVETCKRLPEGITSFQVDVQSWEKPMMILEEV